MLVILIVILILIWAAVVWSIYSNFLVFYSSFSETENYHKAYYASISALERGELVTKQRQPWYVWSGWFIRGIWTWGFSWSDKSLSWFSYYGYNKDDISVFWTINSRTTRIPATWWWDVEWMLSADDSSNYNAMNYDDSEVFLLYYDNSSGNPYTTGDIANSQPGWIGWEIRLPKLLSGFWPLDTETSLVWLVGALPANDSIVDWQIRWQTRNEYPITIYSTESVEYGGWDPKVNMWYDSVFRESDINTPLNFLFSNSSHGKTPIVSPNLRGSEIQSLTMITKDGDVVNYTFEDLFRDGRKVQLKFSLLNLLKTKNKKIYPFLEYYVDFGSKEVSDKYFSIDARWEYKGYSVDTVIRKPTVKESVFSSFTTIF